MAKDEAGLRPGRRKARCRVGAAVVKEGSTGKAAGKESTRPRTRTSLWNGFSTEMKRGSGGAVQGRALKVVGIFSQRRPAMSVHLGNRGFMPCILDGMNMEMTAAMDTSCRHRRWSKNSSSSSAPSEDRDWAALPHDVLFDVFLRLGSCEIMWGAEGVCKAWRRVVLEETKLWRRIHITAVPEWSSIDIAVRDAVDRSAGQCESFSGPWDDESLLYLAERSPALKHLHLSHEEYATYEVLIEAIEKLPLLEDLEISPPYQQICASEKFFESICKARPLLKNIKIMFTMPPDYTMGHAGLEECIDGDIYRTPMMCELRSLQLSNYVFSGLALTAILDNCPLLELLTITGLFVDGTMDEQLWAKCARIKNLNLPYDSDEEYEEPEEDEGDEPEEEKDHEEDEDEEPSDLDEEYEELEEEDEDEDEEPEEDEDPGDDAED